MTFVAASIIGGLGAIGGALIMSNSSRKAVDAQTASAKDSNAAALQAQREAQAFEQKQLDQARADNEPWRVQGGEALNKLAAAPDFSFEGMRGITNSAAARGGLLSGAALKASTRYAQDYAGTKFGEAYGRALQTDTANKNRLQSLAGIGQTAVGNVTQAGMQAGSQIGQGMLATGNRLADNALGVGNARASGYLANGNALTGALNQGVSAWTRYNTPVGYGGNGRTLGNQFSGGNDGWTLPNGESLGT
jgi:hypothetical protein